MSFFEELKRRNVFRVGIAYVLMGWLLLQGADFALDLVDAPNWAIQALSIAVVTGLPIALFFAWAFEMTPEGIKLESEIDRTQSITPQTGRKLDRTIILFLAVAVVLLLADKFFLTDPAPPSDASAKTIEAKPEAGVETAGGEKSIAVLPFVDMSPEGDQAYFADGIAEEILNVLVKTQSLKVAGRTSSFQFRGGTEDLRMIGSKLGVEHILEGSIRKARNRVRITAQLVKAQDGFHLWSDTYDRELTDIFAIQDEIARAITDALAIELDLDTADSRLATEQTGNMEAYDHYLEARALIAQRLDFERAIELLNEAVERDPGFAEAWAANAQAHALAVYYLFTAADQPLLDKAEQMALRALEINPELTHAHSALGDVYRERQDWSSSRDSYRRALALNPDDVEANEQYAQMLGRAGYMDQTLEYSTRAAELDPLSFINLAVNAANLYTNGRREAAWRQLERSLTIGGSDKSFAPRHGMRMALSDGDMKKALELFRLVEATEPEPSGRTRQLLEVLPARDASIEVMQQHASSDSQYENESVLWEETFWAVYFGELDLAGKLLSKGATRTETESLIALEWLWYPALEPLFGTDAFKDIIRQAGLPEFWAEAGYPNICRPLGDDDFICSMKTP